jgi:hypothetical protein
MRDNADTPRALPEAVLDVCRRLEERGIPAWSHGEGLLEDLHPTKSAQPTESGSDPTRALICTTSPSTLLEALPRATVTAEGAKRLTLATNAGPIDLLAVGNGDLKLRLLDFGLSPLAFAYRPMHAQWCDPTGARAAFDRGLADLTISSPDARTNPFGVAPRRYWILARLLAEYSLEPTLNLMEAARSALPDALERLPLAAPARREMNRVLVSAHPELGLAFLRRAGVSPAIFPGMNPAAESVIPRLTALPALRWAAWLRGTGIQRALVRFRMPPTLARRIEHLHRAHPIDQRVESLREVGVRKILNQLRKEEIDGLFAWRRLELASETQTDETRAHLAGFVEASPESNAREPLERELADWAAKNRDAID